MKQSGQGTRARRLGRSLAVLVLLGLGALVAAELMLQVAAFFVPDRAGAWRPESSYRILCIGDSHTWGGGVDRGESYPAQLQRFLDEAEPGIHSVMNVGVPGMNTSQLRSRLPEWLSRHQPDVLIAWAGVNNSWNSAEVDESPGRLLAWLDRELLRSRLYRLTRVRIHDRALERYAVERHEDRVWQLDPTGERTWTIRHDGVVENLQHEGDGERDIARIEPRAVEDFRAIAKYARTTGTRLVFVAYPFNIGVFVPANVAMWRVSEEYDVPLVRSWESVTGVAPERGDWLWAMHPGPATYLKIARDVSEVVLDRRAGHRADMTAAEFRTTTFERLETGLRALKQVALAKPPFTAGERDHFDAFQRFLGVHIDVEELAPITPSEFAARITDPATRGGLVAALEEISLADGHSDAEEAAFIRAIGEVAATEEWPD